jgi:hypothetical protein
MSAGKICSIPNCGKPHRARGFCKSHWLRNRLYGSPFSGQIIRGEALAFVRRVLASETDVCVPWPYGRKVRGYGVVAIGQMPTLVHRHVCEQAHGPSEMLALHSCDNPPCINPRHLRWGTQSDNMRDRWSKKK